MTFRGLFQNVRTRLDDLRERPAVPSNAHVHFHEHGRHPRQHAHYHRHDQDGYEHAHSHLAQPREEHCSHGHPGRSCFDCYPLTDIEAGQ